MPIAEWQQVAAIHANLTIVAGAVSRYNEKEKGGRGQGLSTVNQVKG